MLSRGFILDRGFPLFPTARTPKSRSRKFIQEGLFVVWNVKKSNSLQKVIDVGLASSILRARFPDRVQLRSFYLWAFHERVHSGLAELPPSRNQNSFQVLCCLDFNQLLLFLYFFIFKVIHIVLAILNFVLAVLHSLLDRLSCFGNTKLVVVCYGSVLLACDIHGQYTNKSWQY